MRVIGTAGHVDHGKSTLISILTGIHPDRLKEEKEREMTIDLGFGWLTLPAGEEVGIVDVPGHRDFIGNMLAGVGGIDAVLLVIAADEGIMPQSKEHLAIIDLLHIKTGIIVLNKIDLVQDQDWLGVVEDEIRTFIKGTVLEKADIVRVSSKTGEGIPELIKSLENILGSWPDRSDLKRPRLPVDRVFTLQGFGTVVTGTLVDGHFSVGDEVELLPSGMRGHIRGLQTHKKKEATAMPGSRTAINLSGIDIDKVHRGEVVTLPGTYSPTRMMDVSVRLLPDISGPLLHNAEVKIYLGTSENMAKVRLLGSEKLEPGQEGWLQIESTTPLVAVRGDRFILRRPSPGETIGGGIVVESLPQTRHKRFDEKILKKLSHLESGDQVQVLLQTCTELGPTSVRDVLNRARMEEDEARPLLDDLVAKGQIQVLDSTSPYLDTLIISKESLNKILSKVDSFLSAFHAGQPLRFGMPREELKSKLNLSLPVFNALIPELNKMGRIILSTPDENMEKQSVSTRIALPSHTVHFTSPQQKKVDSLLSQFKAAPYSPPSIKECITEVGEDVYVALIESGEIIAVSGEVAFRKSDYNFMVGRIKTALLEKGQVSLAEVRDMFHTSRRYVQALLEHLDSIGMTMRNGDFRKINKLL